MSLHGESSKHSPRTSEKNSNRELDSSYEDDGVGSLSGSLSGNLDSDEDAYDGNIPPISLLTPPTDVDTDTDIPQASMAENPFESEASQVLFEAFDQLHSCNAKKYIDVPQVSRL